MMDLVRTGPYPQIPKKVVPTLSESTLSAINDFLRAKAYSSRKKTLYEYLVFIPKALTQIGVYAISDITKEDIRNWINVYLDKKSRNVQCHSIGYLATFFRHCQKRGFISEFPITRRMRIKAPPSRARNLDEYEYSKVKKLSETLTLQKRLIVEFLDSTGARCGELLKLKVSDIDFATCEATVVGKGGKTRTIRFSKECSYLFKELIKQRESDQDYVFRSPTGKEMYPQYIQEFVSKLGKDAGLKSSLIPHKFRHSKATREVANGRLLKEVSEMLGHRFLVTTMIYVHLISQDVKTAYERAMESHDKR